MTHRRGSTQDFVWGIYVVLMMTSAKFEHGDPESVSAPQLLPPCAGSSRARKAFPMTEALNRMPLPGDGLGLACRERLN